jgi:hypothetical protein
MGCVAMLTKALIWLVFVVVSSMSAVAQSPPSVDSAYYRIFSGTTLNHTFTQSGGTPPIVWDNFTFEGVSGPFTGLMFPATFDTNTQLFSWWAIGARRNEYVWSVRASNGAGSNTGTITISTYIPEPSTLALCVIATVSLLGRARRRR